MRLHELHLRQRLPGLPGQVFPFFADAHNLEAITPAYLRFAVVTPGPVTMAVGTLIQYRLHLHGVPLTWLTSIQEWEPGRRFVDVQVRGPYALWHHTHAFAPDGRDATLMTDHVRYALPAGALGGLAHRLVVRRDLERIFAFRARAVAAALAN